MGGTVSSSLCEFIFQWRDDTVFVKDADFSLFLVNLISIARSLVFLRVDHKDLKKALKSLDESSTIILMELVLWHFNDETRWLPTFLVQQHQSTVPRYRSTALLKTVSSVEDFWAFPFNCPTPNVTVPDK